MSQPPKKMSMEFLPISDLVHYTYEEVSAAKHRSVNITGVIVDMKPPKETHSKDIMLFLGLRDQDTEPSNEHLVVNIFGWNPQDKRADANANLLTVSPQVGDTVILRSVKLQWYGSKVQCLATKYQSGVVMFRTEQPSVTAFDNLVPYYQYKFHIHIPNLSDAAKKVIMRSFQYGSGMVSSSGCNRVDTVVRREAADCAATGQRRNSDTAVTVIRQNKCDAVKSVPIADTKTGRPLIFDVRSLFADEPSGKNQLVWFDFAGRVRFIDDYQKNLKLKMDGVMRDEDDSRVQLECFLWDECRDQALELDLTPGSIIHMKNMKFRRCKRDSDGNVVTVEAAMNGGNKSSEIKKLTDENDPVYVQYLESCSKANDDDKATEETLETTDLNQLLSPIDIDPAITHQYSSISQLKAVLGTITIPSVVKFRCAIVDMYPESLKDFVRKVAHKDGFGFVFALMAVDITGELPLLVIDPHARDDSKQVTQLGSLYRLLGHCNFPAPATVAASNNDIAHVQLYHHITGLFEQIWDVWAMIFPVDNEAPKLRYLAHQVVTLAQ